jgi:hypothetical protein
MPEKKSEKVTRSGTEVSVEIRTSTLTRKHRATHLSLHPST